MIVEFSPGRRWLPSHTVSSHDRVSRRIACGRHYWAGCQSESVCLDDGRLDDQLAGDVESQMPAVMKHGIPPPDGESPRQVPGFESRA